MSFCYTTCGVAGESWPVARPAPPPTAIHDAAGASLRALLQGMAAEAERRIVARHAAAPHVVRLAGRAEHQVGAAVFEEERRERAAWCDEHCPTGWYDAQYRDPRAGEDGVEYRFAAAAEAAHFRLRFA